MEGGGGVITANSYQKLAKIPPPSNGGYDFHRGAGGGNDAFFSMSSFCFAENTTDVYTDRTRAFGTTMDSPTFPLLGGRTHVVSTANSDLQAPSFVEQEPSDFLLTLESRYGCQDRSVKNLPPSARYKSFVPSKLPTRPPAYFTIPPGFSPTVLLSSPNLFNSASSPLVDASVASFLASFHSLEDKVDDEAPKMDNFVFRPRPVIARPPNVMGGAPDEADIEECETKPVMPRLVPYMSSDAQTMGMEAADTSDLCFANVKTQQQRRLETTASTGMRTAKPGSTSEHETKAARMGSSSTTSLNGRSNPDGYNWKKYGQKQLKGTERPRSYYKCTYANCPVKKHVECTQEGFITEITYKGEHNHPKPQPRRRSSETAAAHAHVVNDTSESAYSLSRLEAAGLEKQPDSEKHSADFSSSSVVISHATPEQSFCSPSDEEEGYYSTEEQDSSAKRRRLDNAGDMAVPIRTVREPRVVVQTVSQIDILDDGYRWRKYGQKVVKGHSYPRSYYKCTNAGCRVRKHVERSSDDPKSVRTTYEGRHNHDVP